MYFDVFRGYDEAITEYANETFPDCHVIFVPTTRNIMYAYKRLMEKIGHPDKKDLVFVQRVGFPEFSVERRLPPVTCEWIYKTEDKSVATMINPYLPVNLTYQIDLYVEGAKTAKVNEYLYRIQTSIPFGDYFYVTVAFDSVVHTGGPVYVRFDGISEGATSEESTESFRKKVRLTESLVVEAWLPRGEYDVNTVKELETETKDKTLAEEETTYTETSRFTEET